MPSFLVEGYLEEPDQTQVAALVQGAHALEGSQAIHHAGSLVLLEDEIWFHIFEAPSATALVEASHRAGLQYDRVVEAIWIPGTPAQRVVESL